MAREKKFLIAILAFAFFIRLVPSLILRYPPQNDALQYDNIGWQLATHLNYSYDGAKPTIIRPPAYPVFLALIYGIAGHSIDLVVFVQVLLSVLAVWLVYSLALDFSGSGTAGLVAATLAAIYPLFIYYNLFLYSENLAITAMLVFVLCLIRGVDRNSWPALTGSGLAFAVLVLTKPLFAPVLLLAFWYLWQRERPLVAGLAAFLLPVVIIIGAWTVRNYAVFHVISPFGVGLGRVLYVGNNPAWGALWPSEQEINAAVPGLGGLDDIKYDNVLKQKGIAEIRQAPLATVKLFFIKAVKYLWFVQPLGRSEIFRQGAAGWKAQLFTLIFYYYIALKAVISVMFLVGLSFFAAGKKLFSNQPAAWLLAAIAAYALAAHAVLFVDERYHLPAFPLHLIFASAAAVWLFDKFRTAQKSYD